MTEEAVIGGQRPIVYSHCRLRVTSGPSQGRSLESEKDTIRVGSAPENDLVLEDSLVSRFHFEIRKIQGSFKLVDVGSKNGTFIGEVEIREALIRKRTELSLGESTVALEPLSTEVIAAPSGTGRLGAMVADSLAMRRIFTVVERIASTELPILLTGEAGTGKETLARTIHSQSRRAGGPFVALSLRALPEKLIETALFGYEPQAVPGATETYAGAFERARGGTLFLDDLESLPAPLQARVDRAIERSEIQRVGGVHHERVDARLVAAARPELKKRVESGELSAELYHRLAVIELAIPSLTERREDIPRLVESFFETWSDELERRGVLARRMSPAALERLGRYTFPGNLRELMNILQQAASVARDSEITTEDLPPEVLGRPSSEARAGHGFPDASMPFKDAKAQVLDLFERQYLEDLLSRHEQNISKAAREAGIDRRHLYRLLDKYEIEVVGRDDKGEA